MSKLEKSESEARATALALEEERKRAAMQAEELAKYQREVAQLHDALRLVCLLSFGMRVSIA